MIADYVMRGIDNLFSQKLNNHQSLKATKLNPTRNSDGKSILNKQFIKNSLQTIIRKQGNASKSPKSRFQRSPSNISKSRLKTILQSNKQQRLRSVIKRGQNIKKEASPYKTIQPNVNYIKIHQNQQQQEQTFQKQNNVIHFYRQIRKSIDIKQQKKSRIFKNNQKILNNQSSNGGFKLDRY